MTSLVARLSVGCRAPVRVLAAALTFLSGLLPLPSHADHDGVPLTPSSPLPTLQRMPGIDPRSVTVSGLSSGGFFAHQFHIAHSDLVTGAGVLAGGPYRCAESIPNPLSPLWRVPMDPLSAATVACTHYLGTRYFGVPAPEPKAQDSLELVRHAWTRRMIDDPANLRDDRVWLYHGAGDEIVSRGVAEALRHVYGGLGLSGASLNADWERHERTAEHGIPVTEFRGKSQFPIRQCNEHAPPFIIECGYEAAELLFRHLYPESFQAASEDPHRDGTLIAFDQTAFVDSGDPNVSLDRVAYAYVPEKCARETCRLHVAFHGCRQGVERVGDDFIRDAGFNRWAATNNIVVLYPQVVASPLNPNGCWDFWGYSGPSYFAKQAPQMQAVREMVDRLLGR